jgi:hypothetical protein
MSHQIEVADIVVGVKAIDLAGSYGYGINKKFAIEVTILENGEMFSEYVVLNHRVAVYRGISVIDAVQVYNDL